MQGPAAIDIRDRNSGRSYSEKNYPPMHICITESLFSVARITNALRVAQGGATARVLCANDILNASIEAEAKLTAQGIPARLRPGSVWHMVAPNKSGKLATTCAELLRTRRGWSVCGICRMNKRPCRREPEVELTAAARTYVSDRGPFGSQIELFKI